MISSETLEEKLEVVVGGCIGCVGVVVAPFVYGLIGYTYLRAVLSEKLNPITEGCRRWMSDGRERILETEEKQFIFSIRNPFENCHEYIPAMMPDIDFPGKGEHVYVWGEIKKRGKIYVPFSVSREVLIMGPAIVNRPKIRGGIEIYYDYTPFSLEDDWQSIVEKAETTIKREKSLRQRI